MSNLLNDKKKILVTFRFSTKQSLKFQNYFIVGLPIEQIYFCNVCNLEIY